MNSEALKKFINSKKFESIVKDIYCSKEKSVIEDQRKRYLHVLDRALELYGDGEYVFFSSPGRVEIGGNHTDHQRGNVVAAAIHLDNLCVAKKTGNTKVNFCDDVFKMNSIDISDLSIHENEKGNTKSILRGTAARYKKLGYEAKGFSAFQDMRVLVGSGLSSSACFEILITEIYNYFYNNDKIGAVERAQISQWVENNYFGKPCGLMDQIAISVGSFVGIDFGNKEKPKIKKHKYSFDDNGYSLLIINTKADHADLTYEYAAIPEEMKMVAKYFGKEVLSEVKEKDFIDHIKDIREKVKNDRAIMRAYHYFTENKRAIALDKAIDKKNIGKILTLMNESGNSSFMNLQNVYGASIPKNQAVSIAVTMSKEFLGDDGIARVQGGGFAGTMQVLVKKKKEKDFIKKISKIFGDDAITVAKIRAKGTCMIIA